MERHKFVCSKCGAEYMLQAWKAVCPSCKSEFTLEKVVEEGGKAGRRPADITAILLLAYTLYGILLPSHPTIFQAISYHTPFPATLAYALMIILALLVYVAAEPALWVSPAVGVAALIIGLLGIPVNGPLALIPAAMGGAWAVSSTMAGLKMWRRHAHGRNREERLKEFSGWAGD
jgi:hypothetical protein